jgi:hypothetical protein
MTDPVRNSKDAAHGTSPTSAEQSIQVRAHGAANDLATEVNTHTHKDFSCDLCEAMMLDAFEHLLSAEEQAGFDQHLAVCGVCTEALSEVQRGADLLAQLRSPSPEPPAALVANILARTTGAIPVNPTALGSIASSPAATLQVDIMPALAVRHAAVSEPRRILRFPRRHLTQDSGRSTAQYAAELNRYAMQSRLAMTAAMAFFSLALSFNLLGVQPARMHLDRLRPSALQRAAYTTEASAIRYLDSLRVVHEMETQMSDLNQQASDRGDQPASGSGALDRTLENPQSSTPADSRANQRSSRNQRVPRTAVLDARLEQPSLFMPFNGTEENQDGVYRPVSIQQGHATQDPAQFSGAQV